MTACIAGRRHARLGKHVAETAGNLVGAAMLAGRSNGGGIGAIARGHLRTDLGCRIGGS